MDKIVKYVPLASLITILGFGFAFAKYLMDQAAKDATDEQRLLSTPEIRVKTEDHIENVEEDFKKRMKFEEHVDDIFHKFEETAARLEEQRKQDSIVRMRDAVTNYQTKQQVDTLIKFWKDYNESVAK